MMKNNSNKKGKRHFEEKILTKLNSLLRKYFSDSQLSFVSFTKVELSPEYSEAKIYWDTYDSSKRGSIAKSLEHIKGKLRQHLARTLDVKHTPSLHLVYDSQYEDEKYIENLLRGPTETEISEGNI